MGFLNGEFSVAVHALVILDRRSGVVTSDELAGNICTNPARVRKVMARLVRAGLAESSEGRGSGYAAPGAGAVTLLQVLDAVGARAVDVAWRTGDMDRDCLISSGMGSPSLTASPSFLSQLLMVPSVMAMSRLNGLKSRPLA